MLSNQSNSFDLEVWTEGKTDWKIIRKALQVRGTSSAIKFHEFEENMGDSKLLQKCKTFAEHENTTPMVFIFDHDRKDYVEQVTEKGKLFKSWGNNVYSFAIPIPEHRLNQESISIEFYFTDNELHTFNKDGRRLFLTSEFIEQSGKHKDDPKLSVGDRGVLHNYASVEKSKIIDSEVFNEFSKNVALTKSDFADAIANDIKPFSSFDFSAFDNILEIFSAIISITKPSSYVYFPDLDNLINNISKKHKQDQLLIAAKAIYDLCFLALEIFCITAIRVYEDEIVNEPEQYRKKVHPIKIALSERLTTASFQNLYELTKACFHIVDAKAPAELIKMKDALVKSDVLGEVGEFLDNLQELFPPEPGTPMVVDKKNLNRDLFSFVLPHLGVFSENIQVDVFREVANNTEEIQKIDFGIWVHALKKLHDKLSCFFGHELSLRMLESWDPGTQNYIASVRIYKDNKVEYSEERISPPDAENFEARATSLILENGRSIPLFPFLVIKDDKLHFYRRTRFSGFTYTPFLGEREHVEKTKRKFNHVIFKTGSRQELFWTDVIPTTNPANNIRANIPVEDELKYFVGRSRQKRTIREEIIEIPNQNGFIYGAGGIGKTALLIQLTKDMYNEGDIGNVLFDNIFWISAKTDYYDYIHGTIEKRSSKFRTLEQIIEAMLEYFDFTDIEEYALDDKKRFVLDSLRESRTLLILDNFETILAEERVKIIKFFDVEVKRELRDKPEYFKVIITSRKHFPSSFHPLKLTGLDPKESKQLMTKLYKKYEGVTEQLSLPQQDKLHDITLGIPIVIKHCYARYFEYNESFDYVVNTTGRYEDEVVQFSFKEILQQIETADENRIQLRILLLLELINYPLMTRQISDILGVETQAIEACIPTLIDFQCLSKTPVEDTDKYEINPEIRLLTRALAQKYSTLSSEIRNRILSNYTVDKQLDYSEAELRLIGLYNNYLGEQNFLEAENFIIDQIKKNPESIILKYYYARYQKNHKGDVVGAIKLLESIREKSRNHPEILMLLVECYVELDIPNFEQASVYANELSNIDDVALKIRLAEFYVRWSTSIKMKRCDDPFDERNRQSKYKDLASKALDILDKIEIRTHHIFYLIAQSYFNLWEYDDALRMVNKAIDTAEKQGDFSQTSYHYFRNTINGKIRDYKRQSFT